MNKANHSERRELWRQRVAEHNSSGQSVRAFCRAHEFHEHSFYYWRKQLAKPTALDNPVRFALVDTTKTQAKPQRLELVFNGGEKLLIPAEEATLRLVLRALAKQV